MAEILRPQYTLRRVGRSVTFLSCDLWSPPRCLSRCAPKQYVENKGAFRRQTTWRGAARRDTVPCGSTLAKLIMQNIII